MSFSAATHEAILKHHLGIALWTARAGIYLGCHLPTALDGAVAATDTTIDVDDDIPDGAKIIIDPQGANPETRYAGTVTGAGPYTVPLLNKPGGTAYALAYSHDDNVPVLFDPDNDLSLSIEPTSSSYARKNFTDWVYDGVTPFADKTLNGNTVTIPQLHQVSNNSLATFVQATTEAWGLIKYILLYEADTGGTPFDVIELDDAFDVVLNSVLQFPAGNLKIITGNIN